MTTIRSFRTADLRIDLPTGVGSDAVHTDPVYGYAVTLLEADNGHIGTGINYTLGGGTNLVCTAIGLLVEPLLGREIEALMSGFGEMQRQIAEHHQLRWLGPHKGVTHAALASITIACYDLWAKSRRVPLWRLLLDLSPEQLANLIDFTYLEDELTRQEAIEILRFEMSDREQRKSVLETGYPGYDTSVGWFQYDDDTIRENARRSVDQGFAAMKLKVGSRDADRDVRRANLIREEVGAGVRIMLDANQAWNLPQALKICSRLDQIKPYWVEEPTQPDDVLAHKKIAEAISPVFVAVGESIHNRVVWKNYFQTAAVGIVQADCTRLAGISEYLAVTILARKFGLRVVPHVGDMGQVHQHLVLFNHIALNHECLFLEYIPHLRERFVHPARVENGCYQTPQEPGCSTSFLQV